MVIRVIVQAVAESKMRFIRHRACTRMAAAAPHPCAVCGRDTWLVCDLCLAAAGGDAVYYCGVDCQRRDWRRHRLEVHAVPEPPRATGAVRFGGVDLPPELVIEIVSKMDAAHERDYVKAAHSAQRFAAVSNDAYVAVNDFYLRRYALEIGAPSDAMPGAEDARRERGSVVDWPRRYVATRRALDAELDLSRRFSVQNQNYFSYKFIALLIAYNAAAYVERSLTPAQQADLFAGSTSRMPYIDIEQLPTRRITEMIGRFTMTRSLILGNLPNLREISPAIGKLDKLHKVTIHQCPRLDALPPEFYRLHITELQVLRTPRLENEAEVRRRFAAEGGSLETFV